MRSGRYFQPEIETASREVIESRQRELLAERIAYTLERSAFTRDLWARAGIDPAEIRSLEDFTQRAPMFVQTDATMWASATGDPYGGLLCMAPTEIRRIDATSGTTGVPLALPQYDGNPREIAHLRDFCEDGVEPGGTVVRMSPIVRNGFAQPLTDQLGLRAIWLDHSQRSIPAFVAASLRFRPGAVHLLSRPLVVGLKHFAANNGVDLADVFSSYNAAAYGGEPLGPKDRAQFAEWGVPIRVHTSCGNTIAALECREGDGCHTWEDLVLVEVVDPDTGESVPEGAIGEMIVTTLQERATPLLRFRTEDLVRYTSAPCACGRTHGRIWTMGRRGDGIRIAGRIVLPYQLMPILEQLPQTSDCLFQIVLSEPANDVLRLRVGCSGADTSETLRGEVVRLIEEHLGVRAEVELVANEALLSTGPGYKIARIVKV